MIQIDSTSLAHQRVDRYLSQIVPALSRSQISQRTRRVQINGIPARLSRMVKRGDRVQAEIEEARSLIIPEPVDIPILYEDRFIVVINKPAGLVVHPGHGNYHGTLSQGLLHRYTSLHKWPKESGIRPGIVHRLDKETSGVMIAAKDINTARVLQLQFRQRQVTKEYVALVNGRCTRTQGDINAPIARDPFNRKRYTVSADGKRAYTHFRLIRSFPSAAFILLRPYTGRTHQLRVHMQYCGTPIIGDTIYGSKKNTIPTHRLLLHAYRLGIRHPHSSRSMLFRAPIPYPFWDILHNLQNQQL